MLKEDLIKKQDIFVKDAIHEINTPLSVIVLYNDLRSRKYGSDEFVKYIRSSIRNIENTFNDLTYMMKGITHSKLESIDMIELIDQRVEFFNIIAEADEKNIVFNYSEDIELFGSISDISRLIDNNISNAIKYSNSDTVITIEIFKENDEVILKFHNIGLVINNIDSIFNRYFREDNVQGGYGIGLHIVSSIATTYGYKIDVVSNIEDGTTFQYILSGDRI